MTFRKYLVLLGVAVFSAAGDSLLKRGMLHTGGISLHDFSTLLLVVFNPWVACGILLLIAYFAAYTSALSWADLTYVLPATSLNNVLTTLVACFILHESISPARWIGVLLITIGVGFVAGDSSLSPGDHGGSPEHERSSSEAQS